MALTAEWSDPVTGIDADGFASLTKLQAAQANQYLLQNLMYLKQRNVAFVADWDGTVASTTSTSFTDVTGATTTITIPEGGGRIKVTAFVEYAPSLNDPYITVLVDGVNVGHASYGIMPQNTPSQYTNFTGAVILVNGLSAGSKVVKLQFKINSGTFTVVGYSLLAEEI